jgi:hypothetical protein
MRSWVAAGAAIGALVSMWVFATGYGNASPTGLLVRSAFGLWPGAVVLTLVTVFARRRGANGWSVELSALFAAAWIAFLLAGPALYIVAMLFLPRGV